VDPRERRLKTAVAAGVLVLVLACGLTFPWLAGLYGPFGQRAGNLGMLVVLATGLLAGATAAGIAWWTAGRSVRGTLLVLGLVLAVGVVAWPTPVDRTDSFVDVPDREATCRGWEVDYHPSGVMDGSTTHYCVGLTRPVGGP
jgi:hypothetical protein